MTALRSSRLLCRLIACGVSVAVAFAGDLGAQTVLSWTGEGPSDHAHLPQNWGGTPLPPGQTAHVIFGDASLRDTVSILANHTILSATFAAGPAAGSFTFTGSSGRSVTLLAGGIQNDSGFLQRIDIPILKVGEDQAWMANAGAIDVSSDVFLLDNTTLQLGGASDIELTGVIQDTGSLLISGPGEVSLLGANLYTGSTTITGGTLNITEDTALGNSPTVPTGGQLAMDGGTLATSESFTLASNRGVTLGLSGGTIRPAFQTTLTYNGVIAGSGSLTKTGAGTLVLGGNNTYSGKTAVFEGVLSINADQNLGWAPLSTVTDQLLLSGGTLGTTSSFSLNANRGVTLGGAGGTIDTSPDTTLTYAGVISGSDSRFTKAGSGTLQLSGANTYTGKTHIAAGTLRASGENRFYTAGEFEVALAATFDLNGHDTAIGSLAGAGEVTLGGGELTVGSNGKNTVFSGEISGTGALTKVSSGTLTLSGQNSFQGATAITGGSLRIDADQGLGAAPAAVSPHQLVLDGGTLLTTSSFTLSSNRGISLMSGGGIFHPATGTTLSYGGVMQGPGQLLKLGPGTLLLGGKNTYTGATRVQAGMLAMSGVDRLVTSTEFEVAQNAALNLNGHNTSVGSLAGAGNVLLGHGTLTTGSNHQDSVFLGQISGTGGLNKIGSGKLTLLGHHSYSGSSSIQAGELMINGSLDASSPVTVDGSGRLSGTGTVGAITLGPFGTLVPGLNAVDMKATSLTWIPDGIMEYSLGETHALNFLTLSGSFNRGAAQIAYIFDFQGTGIKGVTYTLISFETTDFLETDFSFRNLAAGLTDGFFSMGEKSVSFTPIPEPSTTVALLGTLALLAAMIWRRNQEL